MSLGQESSLHSDPNGKHVEARGFAPRALGVPDADHGPERDRTADLLDAIEALSQLSYEPEGWRM